MFAIYYDREYRSFMPLPVDDPGFFLQVLWQSAWWEDEPLSEAVEESQILDSRWVISNGSRFVSHVSRTSSFNDPPLEESWDWLRDFYCLGDGGWPDEERLTHADFLVRVTDPRWISHLSVGRSWDTAFFPLEADSADA